MTGRLPCSGRPACEPDMRRIARVLLFLALAPYQRQRRGQRIAMLRRPLSLAQHGRRLA